MTTATATPVRPARLGMRGLPTLIATEARLFTRDFGNLFFVLVFPTVLLVGMGYAIPDMREPLTDAGALNGLRVVDLFLPVMFCVAAATAGLAALPAYLASYRETGVLRRLSTTPMRPAGVLLAQVVIHFGGGRRRFFARAHRGRAGVRFADARGPFAVITGFRAGGGIHVRLRPAHRRAGEQGNYRARHRYALVLPHAVLCGPVDPRSGDARDVADDLDVHATECCITGDVGCLVRRRFPGFTTGGGHRVGGCSLPRCRPLLPLEVTAEATRCS